MGAPTSLELRPVVRGCHEQTRAGRDQPGCCPGRRSDGTGAKWPSRRCNIRRDAPQTRGMWDRRGTTCDRGCVPHHKAVPGTLCCWWWRKLARLLLFRKPPWDRPQNACSPEPRHHQTPHLAVALVVGDDAHHLRCCRGGRDGCAAAWPSVPSRWRGPEVTRLRAGPHLRDTQAGNTWRVWHPLHGAGACWCCVIAWMRSSNLGDAGGRPGGVPLGRARVGVRYADAL